MAYVGTFGQAVGVQREFSGVMAKPWRMVALATGSIITLGLLSTDRPIAWRGLTVLDGTFVAIVIGCMQSIAIRLARIMRALETKRAISQSDTKAP